MQENDGKITMSTLQRLPYLERCIKESLRLYPSVPFISRMPETDMKLSNCQGIARRERCECSIIVIVLPQVTTRYPPTRSPTCTQSTFTEIHTTGRIRWFTIPTDFCRKTCTGDTHILTYHSALVREIVWVRIVSQVFRRRKKYSQSEGEFYVGEPNCLSSALLHTRRITICQKKLSVQLLRTILCLPTSSFTFSGGLLKSARNF